MFRASRHSPALSTFLARRGARILSFLGLSLAFSTPAAIKSYTVSAGGSGSHTTIQAAVNDCQSGDVCTITLTDPTYYLKAPVFIVGKSNITIVGKLATSGRPKVTYAAEMTALVANPLLDAQVASKLEAKVNAVFTVPFRFGPDGQPCATADFSGCTVDPKRPVGWAMWPYRAASAKPEPINAPGDKSDTSSAYSSSGFQRNGMFVVEKSVDISIRHLLLDGVKPMYFYNQAVWSQKYDVLFGTVGVNSMQSLRTNVADCEIKNLFSGIYFNGRNPGGTYGQANPDDLDLTNIVPLSRFGKTGDNTIEKNFVHDNWWFLYDEIEWDLGSTIRYNVAWNNVNKAFQYPDSLQNAKDPDGSEWANQTGGFMYMKDVTLVSHKIYNNTIYQHGIILGWGSWRAGTQHLFYNNVVAGMIDSLVNGKSKIVFGNDWHQLLQFGGTTVYNNTFELAGAVKLTSSTKTQAQIVSDTLPDPNNAGKFCTAGCWVDIEPVKLVTQVQPQFIWNGWVVQGGGTYEAYYTDKAGVRWGPFTIRETNMFDSTGLIKQMQADNLAADSVIWLAHRNMYAFTIPFQSRTPTLGTFLMPDWSTKVVANTIRHQGWAAAQRNLDGSLVDRGAYCYDSLAGKTILGTCGLQASLKIIDQQIVKINLDTKDVEIPVKVIGVGGTFTDIKIDSIYYYSELKWADSLQNGENADAAKNSVMPTPIKIPASAITFRNDSVFFKVGSLPATTMNFARFDIFASGVVSGGTDRISATPGIFIWRRNPVELALKVCEDQACTKPTNKVGVGDTVFLDVQGQTSSGTKITTDIMRLYLNPPAGVRILDLASGKEVDTAMFRATVAGGHGTFKIVFETRFNDALTAAGIAQDPVSKGFFGAVGQIALHVTSGKPWRAEWENPRSLASTNHACKDATDTTNTNCDEIPPISPFTAKIHLYDRFGNSVDGYDGKVLVTVTKEALADITVSATAAGAYAKSVTVNSVDSSATVYIVGTALGGLWPKTWGELTVQVVEPGAPLDTTWIRVGKPADHLKWVLPEVIDTFVRVPRKVTLMVTKDDVNPNTASAFATSKAYIGTLVTRWPKFYADAALTIPLGDSVALVGAQASFYVVSEQAYHPLWDSLVARMYGIADSALYPAGVRFRMPPKPDAPEPDFGAFLDDDCNGTPDSVFLKWLPTSATVKVATLDTSKVRIDKVVIASGKDTLVLDSTAVHYQATVPGGVGISLPATAAGMFKAYNPTATIRVFAALNRYPANDTIVQLGAEAAVKDGISPRPIGATLVENPDHANAPDSLTVIFSEPVKYTGTKWPFRIFSAGMVEVAAPEIVVESSSQETPNSVKFVLRGNTLGHLDAGSILAIAAQSGLSDAAGNDSKFSACGTDTTLVILKPTVVQVVSSVILDKDGDGVADFVRVVFRRDFLKESERPNSLIVSDWDKIASAVTLDFAKADSIAPQTYEIALPSTFPLGATVGRGTGGAGTLTVIRGVQSVGNPGQVVALTDSVPPIAVGVAKIAFGTAVDTLTVTYSEPMAKGTGGTATMVLKGTDQPLVFTNGVPDDTKRVWKFDVARGTLQVGDYIRLPAGAASQLQAGNGALPSTLGNAPYVPVVGGDRAPDSALVLDRNGDGTADAVRLFYTVPPLGNPTFAFTWAGKEVKVDSAAYGSAVAGKNDVTIPVSGFGALVTSGTASATSTSFVDGSATAAIGFPIKDGVAPVLLSAYVSYGMAEGDRDTLILKLSEAAAEVATSNGLQLLANHLGTVAPVRGEQPSLVNVLFTAGSSEFRVVCSSDNCNLPGYGDFARLATGSVTDLVKAVVGDSSRWVPVTTGPKPIRYKAEIYPKPVMEVATLDANPLRAVDPLSAWVRPENGTQWSAQGPTAGKWPAAKADNATIDNGVVGVKLDLNTSFDGQFIAYDNLGTYVGSAQVKLDLETLQKQGLTNGANKYSLLIGLNGGDDNGNDLASGVYMVRVISYSEQIVNGQPMRVMVQNKLFSVGLHNKTK